MNLSKEEGEMEKYESGNEGEDIFCSIKADEVPPVPENKFLMRGNQKPAATTNDVQKLSSEDSNHRNGEGRRGRNDDDNDR